MPLAERAQPYVDRLLEDRELQSDLRELAAALRRGAGRAQAKRSKPAGLLGDRRLKKSAERAAASLKDAGARFRGEAPKHHRLRKVLIVVAVVGGAALAGRKLIDNCAQQAGLEAQPAP
jgi:hypothetical protein